jgi:DNA-3-methyladenine glycosylase I
VGEVAAYDEAKVQALLQDAGIIAAEARLRLRLARAAYVRYSWGNGSFCNYLWSFSGGKVVCSRDRGIARPARFPTRCGGFEAARHAVCRFGNGLFVSAGCGHCARHDRPAFAIRVLMAQIGAEGWTEE